MCCIARFPPQTQPPLLVTLIKSFHPRVQYARSIISVSAYIVNDDVACLQNMALEGLDDPASVPIPAQGFVSQLLSMLHPKLREGLWWGVFYFGVYVAYYQGWLPFAPPPPKQQLPANAAGGSDEAEAELDPNSEVRDETPPSWGRRRDCMPPCCMSPFVLFGPLPPPAPASLHACP